MNSPWVKKTIENKMLMVSKLNVSKMQTAQVL